MRSFSGVGTINIKGYRCERCGHDWRPRPTTTVPATCPHCKSPYWNRPRRQKATAQKKPTTA